jgi:hypothetical protein
MGFLDEGLGFTINLAEKEIKDEIVSAPESIKDTSDVSRVARSELELTYIADPISFNSINKATQMIMSAGYELRAKSKTVKNFFIEFFDNIGRVGEDITFDEILESIFQNQMIYGNAYIETVLNKQKNLVVDLVILDPKNVDYARDVSGTILLDNYGKPKGYAVSAPLEISVVGKGDTPPKEMDVSKNQVFLIPERIAHFKLYTYGNRFNGMGLIESAYKSIVRKQNIEEAQTNSIYQRGTYPIIDQVGDENHFPTPNQIKNATTMLKEMQHNRYFAVPYWHKIQALEVRQSDIVERTAHYLREAQAAASGMPLAFATGSGEATNRATLATQLTFLEFTLNDIVKKTVATFKKYILKRISDFKSFSEVPELVWGDISAEEINDKAGRLNNYVKFGILSPESVKAYAINSEKLEVVEGDEKGNKKKEEPKEEKPKGKKKEDNENAS